MSEPSFDDKDMMSCFLREDSELLLTQIKNHIHFLAQPPITDETKEWAPVVGMAELMFCLDQLAEQLELVLKDVSLLARPSAPDEAAGERPQATLGEDEEEEERRLAFGEDDQRLTFGVTLDQFDKLRLLVAGIKAFGDAVFADGSTDFADRTLSMMGFTIFDRAFEVADILMEIQAQSLPGSAILIGL